MKKHGEDDRLLLKKSIKELRCLYDVARIACMSGQSLSERITEIVKILPPSFTFPDIACARITVDGIEYKTDNFALTQNMISADITAGEKNNGKIEVGYIRDIPAKNKAPFTKQEILLLHAIADRLSDIVDHRQTEDALRESEEKFSKAFHASPAVIVITSLEDGRIIDVNDAFTRLTGYTREEAIKLSSLDIGSWHDIDERERFKEVLKTQGKLRDKEMIIHTKAGEERILLYSADLIKLHGEKCIIKASLDITGRRKARDFMQSIFDSSPLGIFVISNEKIRYTNTQLQQITGYKPEELLNTNPENLVASKDIDIVRASAAVSLQEKIPYPCEYRLINKNGQVKWVLQTVSPFFYEGKEAVLGNLMDITERKYLERKVIEYEELNKMKVDLLANVSHELRTPLAAIKGYATMALDYFSKMTRKEIRDCLRPIDNSTDKLIKMVDDLLDASRMESGMMSLEKTYTNIVNLIESVVKTVSGREGKHHIRTDITDRLPQVLIDVRRIRQVLENLLNNAVKFSPQGAEILVASRKKGMVIEISVTDSSSGISADELMYIFDRMYNVEKKGFHYTDTLGLSLYICQRVVEAHGGLIWAEKTPGTGTTITFSLPLKPGEN